MSEIIHSKSEPFVLNASELVESLSGLNPEWTKLRIGIRLAMSNSTPTIANAPIPRLAIGLCHGSLGFNSDSCDHCVGGVTNAGYWVRKSFPLRYDVGNGVIGTFGPAVKIGATLGVRTSNVDGPEISAAPDARRTLLFVDIERGATDWLVSIFRCSNMAPSGPDVTAADFAAQVISATPTFAGHLKSSAFNIAVDETVNGFLDAVNVAWNREVDVKIHDLAVVDLS